MPGPHVDKVYQDALDKMSYEGMTPEQLKNATPEQQKTDAALKKPEMGKTIFAEIEKDTTLTQSEKQEVYQQLVKTGVQSELDRATNPATLLRGNSQVTHFTSAYMNTYAKDYLESVVQDTMDEASKVKIPQSLNGKTITQVGSPIDGVSPQDIQQLEGAYVQIAKKMMDSSEANLSKLTPEAREFLKASLAPTQGKSEAMNMAAASTMLLRGASAMTSSRGAALRDNKDSHLVGALVVNSSVVVQSYANAINKPPGEKLSSGKAQDPLADRLRTEENLKHTKDAYTALSKGSRAIEGYSQKRQEGIVDANLSAEKTSEIQDLTKKLEPQMAKIAANEKRLADLNKPISIEKMKAFFSRKGVEGTKAELKAEVSDIQKSVKESMNEIESNHALAKDKLAVQRKTGLDPNSMESALKLPAVNKAMMDFAKKEFATENLEFMEAVKQFKAEAANGASIEQLRKSADDIRSTYLQKPDGAVGRLGEVDKSVNLSAGVRNNLEKSLDKISQSKPDEGNFQTWGSDLRKEMSGAFDEANTEVFKMAERDTFRRFQVDSSYKKAMQQSAKPEPVSVGEKLGIDRNAPKVDAPKQKLVVK